MPAALLLLTVLVVAASLRASITSVGPVLGLLATDTGLGEAQLGLLTALPLIAFAVVSPLVQLLARRFGPERAVLLSLAVLSLATVLRSVPWEGWLWIGTALIGAAIAVGNVLMPAIVKRDFPQSIGRVTSVFSAVLSAFAATASGLALPIGDAFGWRVAVGCWAVLSAVALLVWLPRARGRASSLSPAAAGRSMWGSPTAWHVALFMGTQSTTFYLLINWLPTIEYRMGVDPFAAGVHLVLFQVAGIVAGLLLPLLMRERGDLRAVAAGATGFMVIGMLGLLLSPANPLPWVAVAGASSGATLVIALTFMAQRARNAADAGSLSGMVQGVGYGMAILGPLGAGVLLQLTGAWQSVVIATAAVAAVQVVVALYAGRDRFTHAE